MIRLVGVGSLDKQAAAGLESVLASWAQRDEGIESFVPKVPANATDLTSATQYLLANRSPDAETETFLLGQGSTARVGSGLDDAVHGTPDSSLSDVSTR